MLALPSLSPAFSIDLLLPMARHPLPSSCRPFFPPSFLLSPLCYLVSVSRLPFPPRGEFVFYRRAVTPTGVGEGKRRGERVQRRARRAGGGSREREGEVRRGGGGGGGERRGALRLPVVIATRGNEAAEPRRRVSPCVRRSAGRLRATRVIMSNKKTRVRGTGRGEIG